MKHLGHEINTEHQAKAFLDALINSGELSHALVPPKHDDIGQNSLCWIDVRLILANPSKFPNLFRAFTGHTTPDEAELEAVYKKDGNAAGSNFCRRTLQKHFVVHNGKVPVAYYFHLRGDPLKWDLDMLSYPFLHKPKREEDALDSVL